MPVVSTDPAVTIQDEVVGQVRSKSMLIEKLQYTDDDEEDF
jgi:hypothetical protein